MLVVPGGVDPPGGARVIPFVHDLVRRLATDRHVRVVAVGHDPEPGTWELLGAEVVNVPVGRHSRADVARVVSATARLVRGADVVHGFWATLPGMAAALAARRHRVPCVVSLAGGELTWLPDIGYGGGRTRGTRAIARTALGAATVTTAASAWVRDDAARAGVHVHELVVLGADAERWRNTGTPVDRSRLVHVGSLNRVKDQSLLLHAVALAARELPALRLDLCGIDTLDGHHARLAHELGIADRVRFHGQVPPERLPDVVRGAGLHLVSSRHEAGPVSVPEAASCGVPTLGTSVGHVADLAAAERPAAIAVARDAAAMAESILSLVRDERRRDDLAVEAHRWATAHDADHTALAFDTLYRRIRPA